MKNRKIYAANTEKVSEVVKDLEIVKSRFDEFMKGMEIKGLGTKYFSNLSLGKQSFPIEIYDKLARNFNKLYLKKKIDKSITKEDLFVDDERENKNGDIKTVYLEKYDYYGKFGDIEEKIIINRVRSTKKIASLIERFVYATQGTIKRQNKFKDRFYSSEETLQEIRDEAEVNSVIDELEKMGVYIYGGLVKFPIISYSAEYTGPDNDMWEIESFPIINGYYVLLFSSEEDVEYYKFRYEYLQEIDTLEELQKKFPIKFNYRNVNFDSSIDRSDPKNEEHHEILNLMAQEYLELEINEEFLKIIGDIVDLPFSFGNQAKEIIPVMKNKIKNEEENEFEEQKSI